MKLAFISAITLAGAGIAYAGNFAIKKGMLNISDEDMALILKASALNGNMCLSGTTFIAVQNDGRYAKQSFTALVERTSRSGNKTTVRFSETWKISISEENAFDVPHSPERLEQIEDLTLDHECITGDGKNITISFDQEGNIIPPEPIDNARPLDMTSLGLR